MSLGRIEPRTTTGDGGRQQEHYDYAFFKLFFLKVFAKIPTIVKNSLASIIYERLGSTSRAI